jgi:hypothetical protein
VVADTVVADTVVADAMVADTAVAADAAELTATPLEKVREPLRLFGAEPDDSARLTPRLLERVAHVSDDRLGRRLPDALERSPTLPGRFQERGRILRACDQLRITHCAIPLRK